jgi:hypothetical protein
MVRRPVPRRRSPVGDVGQSIGLWLFPYSEEGPEHVEGVWTDRVMCEGRDGREMLAMRVAAGREDDDGPSDGGVDAAWTLSRNAWDGDAVCEGVSLSAH